MQGSGIQSEAENDSSSDDHDFENPESTRITSSSGKLYAQKYKKIWEKEFRGKYKIIAKLPSNR